MTIEPFKEAYPKLFKLLPEDVSALRHILVINVNYHDEDTDEFDAMNATDYNFLLYTTELLQEALGESTMVELVKRLKVHKDNEDFYLSEIDLYGIKTSLNQEGIAHMVLGTIEEVLS